VRAKLLSLLLSPEKLRSPYAGLTVADQDGGVAVFAVDGFGPAAGLGIEPGDLLRTLDGEPVAWSVGWAMALLGKDPARKVTLEFERKGKRVKQESKLWPAAVHALCRQTMVVTGELSARAEGKLVREAAVEFYRKFTGDPQAAPTTLPATLVRVERLHPQLAEDGVDLKVGDLLLGVELVSETASGDVRRLVRFERVGEMVKCFQEHASYEGTEFRTWVWRDGAARQVELRAKRLLP
jgi:hypothetical protein